MTRYEHCIGIDLGGTNIRAGLYRELDPNATSAPPQPIARHREPVGEDRDPQVIAARLSAIAARMSEDAGCAAHATIPVGIGFAGMLRGRGGMVQNSPHFCWREVDFGAHLRGAFGPSRPSWVYNDVNAISFGEYTRGAGVGAQTLLAVFVGTGVGAGVIVDGALLEGASNCAAEIGHVKVKSGPSAAACACGLRGCIEAYIGGSYLQRRIRTELGGGIASGALRLAGSVERLTPGHVDDAARDGDEYALALWAEVAPLLGLVLGNALTLLNPAKLILGGGLLSRTPLLRAEVVAAMRACANPPALDTVTVLDALLGDDAGLIGSALLASAAASGERR